MRKLLKYLKNYKIECVLAPLFKMLEASFELTVPLVVAALIDKGIAVNNKTQIYQSFIILIVLGVVGLLSAFTAQFFAAKAATGFAAELKEDLFKHLMSLSFSDVDNIGTSTMITRMTSDANLAQNAVNMFLRLFLRAPIVVFGALLMAFLVDAKASLVFVAVIVPLFIVVVYIIKCNLPILKNVQFALDKLLLLTRENLSGARVLRAFCKEDDEREEFYNRNNEYVNIQRKSGFLSGTLNPLTYVIVNIGIVLLIYTGAVRVSEGILTQGKVIALYNYMSQILIELIKLANLIVTINKGLAGASRIEAVFDIKVSMADGTDAVFIETDTVVEFENVSLKYNINADEAIENVSFRANKGEIIGIIGGTGAGKSSLISLIPRFYDATEGVVKVYGKDVKKYSLKALRDKVSIVQQKPVLFKGTIRENLLLGYDGSATDKELFEVAEIACCKDVIDSKGGLDSIIEQGGRNLSGGQRQRLTIARALFRKAPILILDDSASALDYATEARLNKNIRELEYKPVTFIVSQRASSVINADKIIVLDDSKVCGIGTHEELLNNCEVYKDIYDTQFS